MDAHGLLAAPRGIELCAVLRDRGEGRLDHGGSLEVLFEALAATTSYARYWEEPEARELLDRHLESELLPIAMAVIAAPGSQWWSSPIARQDQHEVRFDDPGGSPPSGAAPEVRDALVRWRAEELDRERFYAEQPVEPIGSSTGSWWSAPAVFGVTSSGRSLAHTGPVGLSLVEDPMGWTSARCRMLSLNPDATVFEISGPDDWIELVRRYPLPVPNSRRSDWCNATGRELDWVIPDYLAIAEHFDGIHLSVSGYLLTAGRPLEFDQVGTLLAGWAPDETYWLTDSAFSFGPSTYWETSRGSFKWVRAST